MYIKLLQLLVPTANAAVVVDPCPSNLPCEADLSGYIANIFVGGGSGVLYTAFGGILFAMLVFYGFRLIIYSKTDSSEVEGITAYVNALVGVCLVAGATIIAQAVAGNRAAVLAPDAVISGVVNPVTDFIKAAIVGILTLSLIIQGFRMVLAVSDGQYSTAKNNMIISVAGAAMVMISAPIINAIAPGSLDSSVNAEINGMANYLATIFGALAFIAVVVSGIFLVISVDEGLKDKARSFFIGAIVSLIIVTISYSLIQIFF